MGDRPKKRIAYLGSFDFPDRNAAANLALSTAEVITRTGHEVVICGRFRPSRTATVLPNLKGVQVRVAAPSMTVCERLNPLKRWSYYRTTLEGAPGWAAIIAYNMPVAVLLPLLCWSRRRNIPVIAHCTEWYARVPWRNNLLMAIIRNIDTFLRMRVAHKFADGLIVSSSYLAAFYRGQTVLKIPTLSANIIDRDISNSSVMPRIVYAGIPFETCVGVMSARRMKDRLDMILKLLASVSDLQFKLDIYGISRAALLLAVPSVRCDIDTLGDQVEFHGRVVPEEAALAIHDADFTILIRDQNRVTLAGFPTKLTESLRQGTPVLANMIGDIKEYLHDGENGYVLHGRDESIRTLKKALALTPKERADLRKSCLDSAVRLSPESWVIPMKGLLEEIMAKNEADGK